MREGQYEYIHEFKERINEIIDLQRRHYAIIDSDKEPKPVKLAFMSELHRLNITLSNYFDVAPDIINGSTISASSEKKAATKATDISSNLDILLNKPFCIWGKQEHLRLALEINEQCYFNHIVGLPTKENKDFLLFDYEKLLYVCMLTVHSKTNISGLRRQLD